MECIYCLKNTDKFSQEHVIPLCIGKFRDNLTLKNMVCSDCNQYFGNELEIHFRDSIEGIARYRYGMFPQKEPWHKRLKLTVTSPGKMQGVHVKPKLQLKKSSNEAMLQRSEVGFYNKKLNKYVYFGKDDIPKREVLDREGFILVNKEIYFWGDIDELLEACNKNGISIDKNKLKVESPSGERSEIEVLVEARIDRPLMRAFSKIAFNYFSYLNGRTLVLGEYFNDLRNFVRYDQGNIDDFFKINHIPILRSEISARRRYYPGHLVMVEMTRLNEIRASLALFNSIANNTYRIILSRRYSIFYDFTCAHGFNLEKKKVEKIY